MNTEIQQFDYNGTALRALVDEHKKPWFVSDDLFDILGIENGNKVIARLDPSEKNTITISDCATIGQDTTIISESGLCRIALRTWHPQAKGFRHWLTHEVLPSIRK